MCASAASVRGHRGARCSGWRHGVRPIFLAAITALLTLPALAQADVLVSNVDQTDSYSYHWCIALHDVFQGFRTGGNTAGYALAGVEMAFQDFLMLSPAGFTVSIWTSNASGQPDTLLGSLTNPSSLSGGANTFTTSGIDLDANETYLVVVDSSSATSGTCVKDSFLDNEDATSATGWSISDDAFYRAKDSDGQWTSYVNPLKIRINGTAKASINPRVSNSSISIADASAAENAGHLLFEVTLSRALQKTVKVDFETISGGTATEGDDYWPHVYTHVILAGDRTAQMGFALIEDTVNDAGETVKAKLSNAREIDAYGNVVKFITITTDEATGTITAPPASTTNVPGLTIGIQDATGDEDDGWLDFRVRLSQASDDYVCYDFETISGGSATEGTDYIKRPKVGYWMQIGKRVDTPFVYIIDDRVNDNGETVKVKISNAHLCGDPSQTVSITRDEATGTIRNSDPLPQGQNLRKGLRHGPDAEYQTDSGHTLVFPVSAQTSAVRTALALHNPGATVLVVQCAFQTADSVLATVDLELDARGQETGFVDEWFPEMPESGGAVRCTAERRFTGVAVEMDTDSGLFTSLLGKAPAAP